MTIKLHIRRLATKDYWFPRADSRGLAFHFYKVGFVLTWKRA